MRPEDRFFLRVDYHVSDLEIWREMHPEDLFYRLMDLMTRRITDFFMQKHQEDLRRGVSSMVEVRENMSRFQHEMRMGVYIMTPEEMEQLRREIIDEHQGRQKAHSGADCSWQANPDNPGPTYPANRGYRLHDGTRK